MVCEAQPDLLICGLCAEFLRTSDLAAEESVSQELRDLLSEHLQDLQSWLRDIIRALAEAEATAEVTPARPS